MSRALKRGSGPRAGGRRRTSKRDRYKERVDGWVREGIWNAVVIDRMLQELGYEGGVCLVRDTIRPKRPLRKSRATVRFETPPGRQLQSDWETVETYPEGVRVRVEFIVNTLG